MQRKAINHAKSAIALFKRDSLGLERTRFIQYLTAASVLIDSCATDLTNLSYKDVATMDYRISELNKNLIRGSDTFDRFYKQITEGIDQKILEQKSAVFKDVYFKFVNANIKDIDPKTIPTLSYRLGSNQFYTNMTGLAIPNDLDLLLVRIFFMMDGVNTIKMFLKDKPEYAQHGRYFHTACMYPCKETIKLIMTFKPDINREEWVNFTEVNTGCMFPAGLNASNYHRLTPFVCAFWSAMIQESDHYITDILPLLIKNGANVDPDQEVIFTDLICPASEQKLIEYKKSFRDSLLGEIAEASNKLKIAETEGKKITIDNNHEYVSMSSEELASRQDELIISSSSMFMIKLFRSIYPDGINISANANHRKRC